MKWRTSEIADGALWMALILAPVAGGSANVLMLPVLAVIATVSFVACIVEHRRSGSRLYLFMLPFGLVAVAGFTLLQTVPMPDWLLTVISPRTHELRRFVDATGSKPLTYEAAASAAAAAKLIVYAMIAVVAADRSRIRKSFDFVAVGVVVGGLASLLVAFIQRTLNAERMLGVLPSMRPSGRLLTTFVNPNHASAFLLLGALTAVGLALAENENARRRLVYGGSAAILAIGSALCFSRGGLGAMVLSFAIFGLLLFRTPDLPPETKTRAAIFVGGTLLFPGAAVLLKFDELVRAFDVSVNDPYGVAPKIAAVKDSLPLVLEHPLLGIGRGSYESVYAGYKTAVFQLTFTHPENILAQLLSDWGILVGSLALLAFLGCTMRRVRLATSPAVLASMVAILVITAQNLVDFNLELPGMAIPVAALLGAATPRELVFRRVWPKKRNVLRAIIAVPTVLLAASTFFAFYLGNLDFDQSEFDTAVRERKWDRTTHGTTDNVVEVLPFDQLVARAKRHPANAVMAAQLSYLAETASPPDYAQAMRWGNRALLLAPTYADGHLAVGRMLVRSGHREQGFMHMRRGWELAADDRLQQFIRHVITLAKTPAEIRIAIPRRDAALDTLDEKRIAECARELHAQHRDQWAKDLLDLVDPEAIEGPEAPIQVAEVGILVGNLDLSSRVLERRIAAAPGDTSALRVMLDVLWKQKNTTRVTEILNVVLRRPEIDPVPFLRVRIEVALKDNQMDLARDALELMRRKASPTMDNQIELTRLEAAIEAHDGQMVLAVRALERGIQLAPSNIILRFNRAQALAKLGRTTEARIDLEFVLHVQPGHRAATQLLAKLQAARVRTSELDQDLDLDLE